jgi:hypothetical protein
LLFITWTPVELDVLLRSQCSTGSLDNLTAKAPHKNSGFSFFQQSHCLGGSDAGHGTSEGSGPHGRADS